MQVWTANRALRLRVHELFYANIARFERAINPRWPLADVGLDATKARENADRLRLSLKHELRTSMSMKAAAAAYTSMAPRLAQEDVSTEFLSWQTGLRDSRDFLELADLTRAFALPALRLPDEDVKAAGATLLDLLLDKQNP